MTPADDIDRIMTVMTASFDPRFGEAWNRRQVEDAMLLGNCHYALMDAPDGAGIAGFTLSRSGIDEEELLLIAVCPDQRGRGLGSRLIDRLIEAAARRGARRVLLEMRRGNPAETLYRRYGFVPIGERRNYYRQISGERIDAITFARDID